MAEMQWTQFTPDQLGTAIVGRRIRAFPSIGSTNDLLRDAARDNENEGLIAVTDEQTAGRGRRGRTWTAPAGSSLLLSILLRPTWLPSSNAFMLTMLASIAATEAITSVTGVGVDLKWPNDLQIGGRKVGGILVETELGDPNVHWAVIGCGINVNWDPSSIPELQTIATSLSAAHGADISRRELLRSLLQHTDRWYAELRRGARTALFDRWRGLLCTIGQQVRATTPYGIITGLAEDVTPDGGLIIVDQQGERQIVTSGDVTIRPQPLS